MDAVPTGDHLFVPVISPHVLGVTAGAVDSDPVGFSYPGFSWTSESPNCSQGKYDGGSRNMDCSFGC